MGGTSTDVSRYAGTYEHVFETTTAGVTIQVRCGLQARLSPQNPSYRYTLVAQVQGSPYGRYAGCSRGTRSTLGP